MAVLAYAGILRKCLLAGADAVRVEAETSNEADPLIWLICCDWRRAWRRNYAKQMLGKAPFQKPARREGRICLSCEMRTIGFAYGYALGVSKPDR